MEMNGWDSVSALSATAANRALAANSQSLITHFQVSGSTLSGDYEIHGNFGPWQIVAGGSGNLLRLSVPIAAGAITPAGGASIDLTGATAVVDVSLQLLPAPDGQAKDLVFDLAKAGQVGGAGGPGVVSPVHLDAPAAMLAELGDTGITLVLDGVAQALTANAGAVSFVFASLSLIPSSVGGWLTPASMAFVYIEVVGGGGQLCILGSSNPQGAQTLPHDVDPELFAGGGSLAFAISGDLFLTQMITPALPAVFGGGASLSCFEYDTSRHVINAALPFDTNSIKEGAIWYTPRVTTLTVGTVGANLTFAVNGDCDLKAGISMTWWITSQYPSRFDPAGQSLIFADDPRPQSGHQADIPWWFWLGGPLVEAITQVVVNEIADSLAGELNGHLGTQGLGVLAAQPVHWQGAPNFHVTSARLNSALMINGDPA
jgi:Clostridium P-47 protein